MAARNGSQARIAKRAEGVNYARFALVDCRSLSGYNHSNSISAQ